MDPTPQSRSHDVPAPSSNHDVTRVLDYVEHHRDAFPPSTDDRFSVSLHRHVYLSTLYRVSRGDERYLLAIKHHDPAGARARREYEVLSLLGDTLSPKAILLDDSGSAFPDPVLVTTFERPLFVREWTDAHLARLAQVMATIHVNPDLLNLPSDEGRPRSYSLRREFEEEIADVPTFRESAVRRAILEIGNVLRDQIPRWEAAFDDGVATYIHSDLPHHHLFAVEPHWKTVHWEWSRRSHPTRELARALWDMELPEDRERSLLQQYQALVPYAIAREPLEIQRLLQYFYNCVHVAFWLDRTEQDPDGPNWQKAERLAGVVGLWIRMQLQRVA
jgi:hypothetical protein